MDWNKYKNHLASSKTTTSKPASVDWGEYKKFLDETYTNYRVSKINEGKPKYESNAFNPKNRQQVAQTVDFSDNAKRKQEILGYDDFKKYSIAGLQQSVIDKSDTNNKGYKVYKAANQGRDDSYLRKMMDKDEEDIYNYYLGKFGKEEAEKYFESIAEEMGHRYAELITGKNKDNVANQLIYGAAAGLENFKEGTKSGIKMLVGDDEIRPTTAYEYGSQMTRENLGDTGPDLGGVSLGQVGYDLVTNTANMLPSMAIGLVTAGLGGSVAMGLSAAGNTYQEDLKDGYTEGQARTHGILVGAAEGALQYILGGIGALGGKFTTKAIGKFMPKLKSALARVAVKVPASMASEGFEEYSQEILDTVFRNWIFDENNDIDLLSEEAIYSGILGALTAGFIEGPSVAVNESIKADYDQRFESVKAGLREETASAETQYTDDEISEMAENIMKVMGGTATEENMIEFAGSRDEKAVAERIMSTGRATSDFTIRKDAENYLIEQGVGLKERLTTSGKKQIEKANAMLAEERQTQNRDTVLKNGFTEEQVQNMSTEEVAQAATEIKKAEKLSTETQTIAELSKDESEGYQKVISEAYKDYAQTDEPFKMDAEDFANEFSSFYDIGRAGVESVDRALEAYGKGNPQLTNALARAYELGKGENRVENVAQNEFRQAAAKKGVEGKIVFEGEARRVAKNKQQTTALEFMGRVLKKSSGIEYHIFASYVLDKDLTYTNKEGETVELKAGSRVYKDKNGEIISAPSGFYDAESRQIWVDLNAGAEGIGLMLDTLTHEHVHDIRVWSYEHYKQLLDITKESIEAKGVDFDDVVAEMYDLYHNKKDRKDYTIEKAKEEVVAKTMSGLLRDENGLREFSQQVYAKDKTLWEKIKDWFADVVARLTNAYKDVDLDSALAQNLKDQKELYEKAQKIFAEAVVQAGQNYKAVESGAFKGLYKTTEGNSDVYVTDKGNVIAVSEKDNANNVMYNIGEYDNGGRDYLENWLTGAVKKKAVSQDVKNQMLQAMDNAAELVRDLEKSFPVFKEWGEVSLAYDDSGKPIMRCKVKNGDYEINFDFSTVCKKRKGLDAVLNNLIKTGKIDLIDLSRSDIQFINKTLDKYDFEIACALCFVDSKRYRVGEWASGAATMYNDLINSLVKPEDLNKISSFNFGGNENKNIIEGDISTWDDSRLDFSTLKEILASDSRAGGMGYKKAFAKLIIENPKYRKFLSSSDIVSSRGTDRMRNEANDLLEAVNAIGGSSKPKMSNSESVWDHSILMDRRVTAKSSFAMGGARTQSFSDFIATMFFDYCQMFAEAQAKGLPMQAYTKELAFAELFGLTGARINLSVLHGVKISAEDRAWLDSKYVVNKDGELELNITTKADKERLEAIKRNAGLDENGNYVPEKQSIDFDKAVNLQNRDGYSRYLGTIVVGVSERHIWKLLDDMRVRMIIPYHKSGLSPVIAKARNIDCYTDFTLSQNTRLGESWGEDAGKTIGSTSLSDEGNKRLKAIKDAGKKWDFYSVLHKYEKDWDTATNSWKEGTNHAETITYELSSNGKNVFQNDPMRQTCEDYFAWCVEYDMIPQFDQFMKHPNYYKMQEDFDVYDCITGEYVPQTAVEFKLPDNAREVLESELEAQQETSDRLNKMMPKMVDEIVNTIGRKIPPEIKIGKMMDERDSDGRMLSKEQVEFFKDSKVRDKNGNLLTMYHGSENDFTEFDKNRMGKNAGSAYGFGFYFTESLEGKGLASAYAYGDKVLKGYVNIKNPLSTTKKTISKEAYLEIGRKLKERHNSFGYPFYFSEIYDDARSDFELYAQINSRHPDIVNKTEDPKFIQNEFMNLGFDGVIRKFDGMAIHAVTLDSNQFKSVDNKTPTTDPDIRYDDRDTEYINALASGDIGKVEKLVEQAAYEGQPMYDERIETFDDQLLALERQNKKLVKEMENLMSKYEAAQDRAKKNILAGQMAQGKKDAEQLRKIAEHYQEMIDRRDQKLEQQSKDFKEALKAKDKESKLAQDYAMAEGVLAGQMAQGAEDAKVIREIEGLLQKKKAELKKVRERRDEILAERKAAFEAYREMRNNTIRNGGLRKRIEKSVKKLNEKLLKPTDVKHIPEDLKEATAALLENFVNDTSVFPKAKLDALREAYDNIRTSGRDLEELYDEDIASNIKSLKETIGGKRLSELNTEQLKQIYEVVASISHMVSDGNKLFINGRKQDIESFVEDIQITAMKHGNKKKASGLLAKPVNYADKYFNYDNIIPPYFFDDIGGGLKKLYDDMLYNGGLVWTQDINESRQFMADIFEKYHVWDWTSKNIENRNKVLKFKTERGDSVELSVNEALSVYATYKRGMANGDGAAHLMQGGIVVDLKEDNGILKFKSESKKGKPLTVNDIQKIMSFLTEEQMKCADEIVEYLTVVDGEKRNETSMQLHGYKKFNEKYYFPYHVDSSYVKHEPGQPIEEKGNAQSVTRLKNMGSSKVLTPHANAAVHIGDFFDVVAQSMEETASYHGYALVQDNFMRVLNYKNTVDKEGFEGSSGVAQAIKDAYGNEAYNYINKLMGDIFGGPVQIEKDMLMGMLNNFKKTSVVANLSVTVQQPSAIVRAITEIEPKYLLKAANQKNRLEEMFNYSSTAFLKNMGRFDVGTGFTAQQYILKPNLSKKEYLRQAVVTNSKYDIGARDEALGYLTEKADWTTWGWLMNAAWAKVEAETELEPGSEEFKKVVGRLFDRITNKTQVYDSVLVKSPLARSKNVATQMSAAFMNEPILSYNMVMDGAKKGGKRFKTALVAYTFSQLGNAFLWAFVGALRDDDEDKTYGEKYVKAFTSKFVSNIIPFANLPYISQIISIIKGFDVENMAYSPIVDAIEAFEKANKSFQKYEYGEGLKELTVAFNLVGLPIRNIVRDFESLFAFDSAPIGSASASDLWNAAVEGFEESLGIKESKTDGIKSAMRNGNSSKIKKEVNESIQKYVKEGKTEKQAKQYIKTSLTSYWKPIYINNEKRRAEIRKAIFATGLYGSADDVVKTCNKWLETE